MTVMGSPGSPGCCSPVIHSGGSVWGRGRTVGHRRRDPRRHEPFGGRATVIGTCRIALIGRSTTKRPGLRGLIIILAVALAKKR
jgi:hypothetical protein